jgi:hypothetical protein
MNSVKTQETYEQLMVASQRVFPVAPYPRKYVHSVFDDMQDVVQAVQALRTAGYEAGDIHVMSGWDFVEAIEHRYEQQNRLSQSLTRLFFDYGFDDIYLHEARRGHYILAVRPSSYGQIMKVRDLLAPHHARLMKYIDTWTFADLIP